MIINMFMCSYHSCRGSAPPPAPEQVIESLPKRELTEKEKSKTHVILSKM
jgi:hypothetical protein